MRNPTITNELHRKGTMFQNRFMPTLDDPGNELFSGTFRDLILGLVADTATLFQPLQNSGPIIGVMNCTSGLIIFIFFNLPIHSGAVTGKDRTLQGNAVPAFSSFLP